MPDPRSDGSILRQFGAWAVATDGLVRTKDGVHIPVSRLWDLWADFSKDKWGWPILAVQKGWVDADSKNEFNEAYFFALEQFRAFRPPLSGKPSTHATLEYQEVLLRSPKSGS
jgi:hypothetical protein